MQKLLERLMFLLLILLLLVVVGCSERQEKREIYQLELALEAEEGAGGEIRVNEEEIGEQVFTSEFSEASEIKLEFIADEVSQIKGWRYKGSDNIIAGDSYSFQLSGDTHLFAVVRLDPLTKIRDLEIELEKSEAFIPKKDESKELSYQIKALDEAGEQVKGAELKLALTEEFVGIEIKEDKLMLTDQVIDIFSGTRTKHISLEVSTKHASAQEVLTLKSEEPRPSGLVIAGDNEVLIPTKDNSDQVAIYNYQAKVADQYGRIYDEQELGEVSWSIKPFNLEQSLAEIDGIDFADGKLEIAYEAINSDVDKLELTARHEEGYGGISIIELVTEAIKIRELSLEIEDPIEIPKVDETPNSLDCRDYLIAKDQYERLVTDKSDISWSLVESITGVEISQQGIIKVDYTAADSAKQVIEVKAEAGDEKVIEEINLNKAEAKAYQVEIKEDGLSELFIPASGEEKWQYEAIVKDQYDRTLSDSELKWYLVEEVNGVEITDEGQLIINQVADEQLITVIAEVDDSLQSSLAVELKKVDVKFKIINGLFTAQTDYPIERALVEIAGQNKYTDKSGEVQFRLGIGELDFNADHTAYQKEEFTIEIKTETETVELGLELDFKPAIEEVEGVEKEATGKEYISSLKYAKGINNLYLKTDLATNIDYNNLLILINDIEHDSGYTPTPNSSLTIGDGYYPISFATEIEGTNQLDLNLIIWGELANDGQLIFTEKGGANKIYSDDEVEDSSKKVQSVQEDISLVQDQHNLDYKLRVPYQAISQTANQDREFEVLIIYGKADKGQIKCTLPYDTGWETDNDPTKDYDIELRRAAIIK